jgi:hypothetical protein
MGQKKTRLRTYALKLTKTFNQLVFKVCEPTPEPKTSTELKHNAVGCLGKADLGRKLQGPLANTFYALHREDASHGFHARAILNGAWSFVGRAFKRAVLSRRRGGRRKEAGDPEHGQCLVFERFEAGDGR